MVQTTIKVGDKIHPFVISSNALYKLEEKTGLSTERIGLLMVTGRAGYQMLQTILWAGLEGGRLREKTRREPFTIEEVGDLLDEVGGAPRVWQVVSEGTPHPVQQAVYNSWMSAFPDNKRQESAGNPQSESTDGPHGVKG